MLCVLPPILSECHNIWKIYAPGAGISKHKNIFVCIEKNTSTITACRKQACRHEVHSKGLETKDHERELQVHFLKHLIIFKPSVVLEAWLTIFKLLRQGCKCGLHSHTGAALPALLSPCCSGEGKTTKAKQLNRAQCYPLLHKRLLCYHHHSHGFTQGIT